MPSYGRLYRALATFSLTPVIYQLRLQAAPIVVQPGTADHPGPVPEFGGRPFSDASTIGVTFGGLLAGADAKYASGCRLLVALVDVSDDRLTSFIDVDVLGVWSHPTAGSRSLAGTRHLPAR